MSVNKEKIIDVKGLSASFGERKILNDISFSAYANEVTVILGSSGSGKTTILKHLIGLYVLQHGEISIMGQNIDKLDEEEQDQLYLKMGVFFQNGALLNSMTVAENISLPLTHQFNITGELLDYIVRMKLRLVGLEYAFDLYPSELSGGMLKRAALARAISNDPPLLFCDEPGAGLDPVSLASLDQLILNLKNQLGISIILVTHEVAVLKD